jgi:hypothetical protein
LDIERTQINQKIEIFENPTSPCQTTVLGWVTAYKRVAGWLAGWLALLLARC